MRINTSPEVLQRIAANVTRLMDHYTHTTSDLSRLSGVSRGCIRRMLRAQVTAATNQAKVAEAYGFRCAYSGPSAAGHLRHRSPESLINELLEREASLRIRARQPDLPSMPEPQPPTPRSREAARPQTNQATTPTVADCYREVRQIKGMLARTLEERTRPRPWWRRLLHL